MGIEVYTMLPTPFRMGASETPAKTVIEEYERVDIGKGYFGVVFKNPTKKLWHIALEDCGALIGTMESRAALIKRTKNDGQDKKENQIDSRNFTKGYYITSTRLIRLDLDQYDFI